MEKVPVCLLESFWPDGAAFLSVLKRGEKTEFFQPLEGEMPPCLKADELVSVILRFDDTMTSFQFHALIEAVLRDNDEQGVLLSFLPQQKSRLDLILATAEGDSVPYFRRRHERLECHLPVRVRTGPFRKKEVMAENISEGGILLVPEPLFEVGKTFEMEIEFAQEQEALPIVGEVISVVLDGPQKGIGVEFRFASPKQRQLLIDEIEALRREPY